MSQADHQIIRDLLLFVGEDPEREGLRDTPKRVLKAFKEMTSGYGANMDEILKTQFDHEGYDQMVLCSHIEFQSLCEHHLLPFCGHAHVAYIPNQSGPIVGLSKLARLVEAFSRRLQIQERMTRQIAEALQGRLSPIGVGVLVEAKHMCMVCRGVRKMNSVMKTSCLLGAFRQAATREEFYSLITNR